MFVVFEVNKWIMWKWKLVRSLKLSDNVWCRGEGRGVCFVRDKEREGRSFFVL